MNDILDLLTPPWIMAIALVALVFLVWVIIAEAYRASKPKNIKKDTIHEITEDQDIAVVVEKVRSAASHAQYFFSKYEKDIQAKEEDLQSKNRVIKVLEDRLSDVNQKVKSEGRGAIEQQKDGYWADPALVIQLNDEARQKAKRSFIWGFAFGLFISFTLIIILLQLTGLLADLGTKLGT